MAFRAVALTSDCHARQPDTERCQIGDGGTIEYSRLRGGGGNISAVHASAMESFIEAQAPCVAEIMDCPPMGCSAPMIADDGTEVSGPSQVNTTCVDSTCRTVSAL